MNANLRALQIPHKTDFAAAFFGNPAHHFRASAMRVGFIVRKVNAADIQTGIDHVLEYSLVVSRRPEGRHYFRSA